MSLAIDLANDYKGTIQRVESELGRLRKAVTWLVGALHDDANHEGPHDECMEWECQRARTVLEETSNA